MRRAIRGLVVAGLLAIGVLGSSTARAQGYGAYYPGPGYAGGYPAVGAYPPAYPPYQGGGLNIGIGVGGYRPAVYGIYGNGGYPGGYQGGYAHHHRHHRGCGHHGW